MTSTSKLPYAVERGLSLLDTEAEVSAPRLERSLKPVYKRDRTSSEGP